MVTNMPFSTILYPTDFSEGANETLEALITLAAKHHSRVIILFAFRLIGDDMDVEDLREAKKQIELRAAEHFEKIADQIQTVAGKPPIFLSEVGFFSDRILANIRSNNVDTLLLCEHMKTRISEKIGKGYQRFISQVSCPVYLIDKSTKLTTISKPAESGHKLPH